MNKRTLFLRVLHEVSCIHWNPGEQKNSVGVLDEVSCIHWNRDEQKLWLVCWMNFLGIHWSQDEHNSVVLSASISGVRARSRERERESGEACVVFVGGIVSSVCEGFQEYRVRGRFYC